MRSSKIENLILKDVDGLSSLREKEKLARYLKEHPELNRVHREMTELSGVLTEVESSDIPEGFDERVMDEIRLTWSVETARPSDRRSFWTEFWVSLRRRPAWSSGIGVVVTAAIILAIIGLQTPENGTTSGKATATMADKDSLPSLLSSGTQMINSGDIEGELSWLMVGDTLHIKVTLKSCPDPSSSVVVSLNGWIFLDIDTLESDSIFHQSTDVVIFAARPEITYDISLVSPRAPHGNIPIRVGEPPHSWSYIIAVDHK